MIYPLKDSTRSVLPYSEVMFIVSRVANQAGNIFVQSSFVNYISTRAGYTTAHSGSQPLAIRNEATAVV